MKSKNRHQLTPAKVKAISPYISIGILCDKASIIVCLHPLTGAAGSIFILFALILWMNFWFLTTDWCSLHARQDVIGSVFNIQGDLQEDS